MCSTCSSRRPAKDRLASCCLRCVCRRDSSVRVGQEDKMGHARRFLFVSAVVLLIGAAAASPPRHPPDVKVPGLVEPLNTVFLPDGSKAYVGNYGAHWVGVIDVRRHELLKKIQVAEVPGVAKLDPAKYLGEIKGINIPQITNDGKFLYAADTDLGVAAKIDPREDKVVKVIRVGKAPWRIYMNHDGNYAITPNNGDQTISIIDLRTDKVAATLEAGENMTGVNFAAGKAFVISSTSGFVYVYDMKTLRPAGRLKIGSNIQLETATTDTADEKIYLADSTENAVVIIDAKTEGVEKDMNVGLFPWGTHIMDSKDNYCH